MKMTFYLCQTQCRSAARWPLLDSSLIPFHLGPPTQIAVMGLQSEFRALSGRQAGPHTFLAVAGAEPCPSPIPASLTPPAGPASGPPAAEAEQQGAACGRGVRAAGPQCRRQGSGYRRSCWTLTPPIARPGPRATTSTTGSPQ
jgi:hypothetical protein